MATVRDLPHSRRVKYYELIRAGRKQLESGAGARRKLSAAVEQVLDMA